MTLLENLSDQEVLRDAWRKLHKRPDSYGIDQVTIDEFRDTLDKQLGLLSEQLKKGQYKPGLLRGHPLEKGKNTARISDTKDYRILKIPTVRDRVVQKAIEMLVKPHLEKKYRIGDNGVSFAYMDGGSVEKAAMKVREYATAGNNWYYKADIVKFFDEVNKKRLLEMIKKALPDDSLMGLIETFMKIDVANAAQLQKRTQQEYRYNPMLGVAQGSPLSPMFANVYLHTLDKMAVRKHLNLVRYADDLVVLTPSKEDAITAHDAIVKQLKTVGLTLHPLLVRGDLPQDGHEKHSKVDKYNGLQFLGLRFTGSKIYPSGESFRSAIWTVRRAASNHKLPFIKKLTSIDARVQGWCSAYAFTDYLDEPILRNDKLLEDIMTKVLRKSDLKAIHGKSAMQALQMDGYKTRINAIKDKRAEKEKNAGK